MPRLKWPLSIFGVLTLGLVAFAHAGGASGGSWRTSLQVDIERIDAQTAGEMGVFIRRLSDGESLAYAAERPWYLASTTKVPVAIAVLQRVEYGDFSLADTLVLTAADYRDGSGDLARQPPGTRHTIGGLLEKMLTQSDSTAADMLIRHLGVEKLNAQLHSGMVADGFGLITTLLQVRQEAYAELHPKAEQLTNLDFLELKRVKPANRLEAALEKLSISRKDLRAASIGEAFEAYYRSGKNSASLTAYGLLLERLSEGELLTPQHTDLLLGYMENMQTGASRIKAGLPKHVRFAQKTGTQLRRICNMGIVRPTERLDEKVVIAACVEKFPDQGDAELALRKLGAAVGRSGVLTPGRT